VVIETYGSSTMRLAVQVLKRPMGEGKYALEVKGAARSTPPPAVQQPAPVQPLKPVQKKQV
jgi:hypothetical protein